MIDTVVKEVGQEICLNDHLSPVISIFHYIPLHLSKMGKTYGYKKGDLPVTEDISGRLLRLPFYNSLTKKERDYVIYWIGKIINK